MAARVAFLFPGQAAQYVGMGKDLYRRFPEVPATFREATELLELPLVELCFDGPAAELQRTENCQPAIFTLSVAVLRLLERHGIRPSAVAGHSMGEYAALVAAGALSFPDACRALQRRALLMARACDAVPGAMVAIAGLPRESVAGLCSEVAGLGVVQIANYNSYDQVVAGGEKTVVEKLAERALAAGALKATILPVHGAFHTKLMEPARQALAEFLSSIEIREPRIPVVLNVTGGPVADPPAIREFLVDQLTAPVRWVESVEWLLQNEIRTFVEVGPGKILSGLLRSIAGHNDMCIQNTSTAEALAGLLIRLGPQPEGRPDERRSTFVV